MSLEALLKEYQEKYGRRITNKKECTDRIVEINMLGDDISDEQNSELILLNSIKDSYKMSTNINEQNEVMNVLRDITSNYNTTLEIITKELQLSIIFDSWSSLLYNLFNYLMWAFSISCCWIIFFVC